MYSYIKKTVQYKLINTALSSFYGTFPLCCTCNEALGETKYQVS